MTPFLLKRHSHSKGNQLCKYLLPVHSLSFRVRFRCPLPIRWLVAPNTKQVTKTGKLLVFGALFECTLFTYSRGKIYFLLYSRQSGAPRWLPPFSPAVGAIVHGCWLRTGRKRDFLQSFRFFRALEQTTLPAPESGEIAEIFAFPIWLPSPVLTLRLEGILLVLFSLPNHESRGNPCNVLSVAARKDDEGWRFFLLSGKVMASFGMCSSAKRHVTVIFFPSKTA